MSLGARIAALDWAGLSRALDEEGAAVTEPFLSPEECRRLRALYEDPCTPFRSVVTMARHGFGRGEYKYFSNPLPDPVAQMRRAFYGALAPIANGWATRLKLAADWPGDLDGLTARCRAAGQTRPTPLLLRYGPGDYNCLHQDLYGEVHFPLQVVLLLSDPLADFEGGELVLVERRPRQQSRALVLPVGQGGAVIFAVRERPRRSSRGDARAEMRHGVSTIRSGERMTLGLIFHDAA